MPQFKLLYKIFITASVIALTGCITVSQMAFSPLEEEALFHQGKYKEIIHFYDNEYAEIVRRQRFAEAKAYIMEGGWSNIEKYIRYSFFHRQLTAALIETGNFERAKIELARALTETQDLLNSRVNLANPRSAFLQQENLIFLLQYQGYLDWFLGKNKTTLLSSLSERELEVLEPSKRIPLIIERAFIMDKIIGDHHKALTYLDRALSLTQELGISDLDSRFAYSLQAYRRKAWIQMRLGRLSDAKVTLQQYEEMTRNPIYRTGRFVIGANFLGNEYFRGYLSMIESTAGAVYAVSRDELSAKRFFDAAKQSLKDIPDDSDDIWDQNALAAYHVLYGSYYLGLLQGKNHEAAQEVEKGIRHLRPLYMDAVFNEIDIESAYLQSAELHYLIGETAFAWKRAAEALELARRYRSGQTTASAHVLLGIMLSEQGRTKEAQRQLKKAEELTQGIENTENWALHYWLGKSYEYTGMEGTALRSYLRAVDEVEKLWDGRFDDVVRQLSFIGNRLVAYEPAILQLVKSKNYSGALEMVEKAKSRTAYEAHPLGIETGPSSVGDHGRYSSLDGHPLNYTRIRQLLPSNTVLLEYYVGERSVIAFAISNSEPILVKVLNISPEELKKKVIKFYADTRYGPGNKYVSGGRDLYNLLLEPFEQRLSGHEVLGFVPHGFLHYLPFHALVLNGPKNTAAIPAHAPLHPRSESSQSTTINTTHTVHIINRHSVFYSPSATVLALAMQRKQSTRNSLLALGGPPAHDATDLGFALMEELPSAADEVRTVAEMYTTAKVFTDEQASETNAKENLSSSDNILISSHAVFSYEKPLKSTILLAPDHKNDGRLTIPEIEAQPSTASVVVLSACTTGIVSGYSGTDQSIDTMKFPLGDDLVSIQRAFLRSGASSVISSLWPTGSDPEASKTLISSFFRHFKQGESRADALRAAQLELLESTPNTEWSHPSFWAPFILSGDWR